MELVGDVFVM